MARNHFPLRGSLLGIAIFALAVLGFALLRPASRDGNPAFRGTAYEPPEPAPAFALTDHTGRTVTLDDFRGSPTLLFFGFTHCPDVCPLTLSKLGRVLEAENVEPDEMQVLLVTVDPERDTPAALADYVRRFGPWVQGLTGAPEALQRLRSDLGVYAGPEPGESAHHQLSHTDAIFGLDRHGQLRVLIHPEAPEEEMRHDVRALLRL